MIIGYKVYFNLKEAELIEQVVENSDYNDIYHFISDTVLKATKEINDQQNLLILLMSTAAIA